MPTTMTEEKVWEETVKWVWPRPLTFAEFLELEKDNVELVDGAVVEKSMVQLEHEKLLLWLGRLIGDYIEERDLGIVLGSRTPVEISQFRGRMPDLLFVQQERLGIVQQKAVYGAPDLVIEIISPNDRPSDLSALEIDYCSIGAREILFLDQKKRRVSVLRKREADYEKTLLTTGTLHFETVEGLSLEIEWLFTEPRPKVRDVLARLSEESL